MSSEAKATPRPGTSDRWWWEAGFSEDEATEWRRAARQLITDRDVRPSESDLVRVASRWRIAGFTPAEAPEWCAALVQHSGWEFLAQEARGWRDAGFSADDASRWSGTWPMPGESVEYAAIFRDQGWHPFHVWLLYAFCVDRYDGDWAATRRAWAQIPWFHALNCARAGMSPNEAAEHLDWAPEDLDRELRRRYSMRTPIDPYVAMHVNHHIWLSYGAETADDAPFYAERLWDLHNEADERAVSAGQIPPYGVHDVQKPTGSVSPLPDHTART